MPRRSVTAPLMALITLTVVAACTSAPASTPGISPASPSPAAATSEPASPSPAAETTPPAATSEAATPPVAPTTGALPTFSIPSFNIPSFAPDTDLEQLFPAEIDGQPVTGVSSASFLSVLQAFAEQPMIDSFVGAMQSVGVDPAGVSVASGSATVGGSTVQVQALRTPGASAATVLDVLTRLDEPEEAPTLTTGNIGGKDVTIATTGDEVEYFYVNGEIAWFLSGVDESQAATIFAALP
jgi:hypothetical protein